jgi:hypothetical protein
VLVVRHGNTRFVKSKTAALAAVKSLIIRYYDVCTSKKEGGSESDPPSLALSVTAV